MLLEKIGERKVVIAANRALPHPLPRDFISIDFLALKLAVTHLRLCVSSFSGLLFFYIIPYLRDYQYGQPFSIHRGAEPLI